MVKKKVYAQLIFLSYIFFSVHALIGGSDKKREKLYTFYTPSHEVLYRDWFLPTITQFDEYDIVVKVFEQTCPTAEFKTEGWTKTTIKKVEMLLDAIRENWGGVFFYSDVDIQFFKPTCKLALAVLGDNDMAFQTDVPRGEPCTGFFVCRANQRTEDVWRAVKERMLENDAVSDQATLIGLVYHENPFNVKWTLLPYGYYSPGVELERKVWEPGMELHVHEFFVLHHANYTVGVAHKIKQLSYVRSMMESIKSKVSFDERV